MTLTAGDGPIPLPPAGLLRDLMVQCERHAQFGLPDAARVAAIAILCAHAANTFTVVGSALNLYIIFLAKSATGKSAAITECVDGVLAQTMMLGHEELETAKGGKRQLFPYRSPISELSSATSVKALMSQFDDHWNTSLLMHIEEGTQELARLFDDRDKNMRQVRAALLKLFSKGAVGKITKGIAYANGNDTLDAAVGACLSMLYEGTPHTLSQNLTPDLLSDGTMSRFCIFEAYDAPRVLPTSEPFNPVTMQTLVNLTKADPVAMNTDGYEDVWLPAVETAMQAAHSAETSSSIDVVAGRDVTRLMRFAGLASIPSDGCLRSDGTKFSVDQPTITAEAVEWAEKVTVLTTDVLRKFIEAGDFELLSDDAFAQAILSYVKAYASTQRAAPKGYEKHKAAGVIAERAIKNSLRHSKLYKEAGTKQAQMWEAALKTLTNEHLLLQITEGYRDQHELGGGRMWRYRFA